jgi:hypothetical protein
LEHERQQNAVLLQCDIDISSEFLETARPDRIREREALVTQAKKLRSALQRLQLGAFAISEQIRTLHPFS